MAEASNVIPFHARRGRSSPPLFRKTPDTWPPVRLDGSVHYFELLTALHTAGLTLKQDRHGLVIAKL